MWLIWKTVPPHTPLNAPPPLSVSGVRNAAFASKNKGQGGVCPL